MLNWVMNFYRNAKCSLKAWAQLPRVARFGLIAVLALLAIGSGYGTGTNTGAGGISAATKVSDRAGTLHLVEHRSPAGVSARIFGMEPLSSQWF